MEKQEKWERKGTGKTSIPLKTQLFLLLSHPADNNWSVWKLPQGIKSGKSGQFQSGMGRTGEGNQGMGGIIKQFFLNIWEYLGIFWNVLEFSLHVSLRPW